VQAAPWLKHGVESCSAAPLAQCLKLILQVEAGGEPIEIRRRGRVVARLTPPCPRAGPSRLPWENLRITGELLTEPDESVLVEGEFEAVR
jgi:antitoxin (DNA-binding transcriptional repressor) of toxin-antitoxin stability system